jgi:hypothetical protein
MTARPSDEAPSPRRLYAAYGSNMCRDQMAVRCPAARPVGTATLAGWRFRINRDGFATLVADPASRAHVLVWELDATDEANLDVYEEVATGMYRKSAIEVPSQGEALIYLAADAAIGRPQPGYLERIVAAADAAGFPPSYVAELAAWHADDGR